MKEKIIITGAKGNIGRILTEGLQAEYTITGLDLPQYDVRDFKTLLEVFPGHSAVIHLAWDTETDNMSSGRINPENALMFENVYRAAVETRVKRVIMASSVHADRFYLPRSMKPLNPYDTPHPDSPYGADKVFMESLGRWYAHAKNLEVICIRFGGIGPENKPFQVTDPSDIKQVAEKNVWLSHRDAISLIKSCIEAPSIPSSFAIIYGISNNLGRIHDISNPVGWVPQDDCNQLN